MSLVVYLEVILLVCVDNRARTAEPLGNLRPKCGVQRLSALSSAPPCLPVPSPTLHNKLLTIPRENRAFIDFRTLLKTHVSGVGDHRGTWRATRDGNLGGL